MKVLKSFLIFALISLFLIPAYSFAELVNTKVEVDLMNLPTTTRNNVINELKKQKENTIALQKSKAEKVVETITVERAKEWGGIAREMVGAVKELCVGLGVEVNKFATTPVGIILILTLVLKTGGVGAISYIVNLMIWSVITTIILTSFRHFHMNKKVVDIIEDAESKLKTKKVRYIQRHEWSSQYVKEGVPIFSVIAHVVIFCALSWILL